MMMFTRSIMAPATRRSWRRTDAKKPPGGGLCGECNEASRTLGAQRADLGAAEGLGESAVERPVERGAHRAGGDVVLAQRGQQRAAQQPQVDRVFGAAHLGAQPRALAVLQ